MVSKAQQEKALRDLVNTMHVKREIQVEIVCVSPQGPAETVVEQLRDVYAVAKQVFTETLSTLKAIRAKHVTECTQAQYADVLFLLREITTQFEELRKEYSKELSTATVIVADRWAREADPPHSYMGVYASAYPGFKARVYLPKQDQNPELYKQICDWLGIPHHLQDRGKELYAGEAGELRTKVVEIDYNGFQDLLRRLQLNNMQPPKFIVDSVESINEPYVKVVRNVNRDIL